MVKCREMYNGRYECTFEDDSHKYTMHDRKTNRKWVPGSVTGRLGVMSKPALINWAAKLAAETGDPKAHNAARDEAAERGTTIHNAIENYILNWEGSDSNWLNSLPYVAVGPCQQFLQWCSDYEVRLEEARAEMLVYSKQHDTCGMTDLVAAVEEEVLTVIDFKTTGRIYPTHMVQVGFYLDALREEGVWQVSRRGILHLRDKSYTYYQEEQINDKVGSVAETQQVIAACVAIDKWAKAGKGRR